MNYQNLDQEIKEYSSYFKYCDSINTKFIAFFKQLIQSGSKFLSKSKKSMEEFTGEINKEEYFPSTLNKSINNYCKELNGIMDKFQIVLYNIEKDIINKLTEFDKNYKTNCKNSLNSLTNLNTYLSDNKNKLEKIKNNYFESCKQIDEYNKKYITGKNKENTKEEYAKLLDQLEKLKQTSETKKIYYRNEVTKINDLLLSSENNYVNIINSILKQEEEKDQFYLNLLLSMNRYIKQYNSESKDCLLKNDKYLDDIYTKRDSKLFSLYFNKSNNNKDRTRFLYEEFFDFENFKTPKTSTGLNDKDKLNNKEIKKQKAKTENDINDIMNVNNDIAQIVLNIGKEPLIDSNTMDNEFIELDNIIFNLINRDEKLADEKYIRIISTVEGKFEGCKNIIFILMGHYYNKNLVKFNSIDNFFLLNSILNVIINYVSENDDYIYIALFVLYIGEKTVYYEPDAHYPSNYLCKIMSKNVIYHTYDFWSKIMNLKIKILAKLKIKEEYKLRRKNNTKRDSFISKFFKGGDNNEKIEREILYSQIYKEKSSIYLNEVLTEYIGHFIHYDFIEKKTLNLIEQFSEQYYLNAKQKNYYMNMIKTSMIYQKEPNPYLKDIKLDLVKHDKQDELNKLYLNYSSNKKFENIQNPKIKILLFVLKYLSNKDILQILVLNKESYSILKKYVYKNILIKYHSKYDIKKHISIWKILLDYNKIKTEYNYASMKDSLKNDNKESIFDTIELDCMRTSFKSNQEKNQIKLGNVLKLASKQIPSVNYCQGMNHLAAFFLIICDENEEETFYLFMSFLLGTDYCSLIENDLAKLNKFFYCFERLLNITLPEMNNFLIHNNVKGAYFLSPWFITLFTISLNQEYNNLEGFMKIFDMFLFSGWKAIFKIGISLIKNNAIKIFSLPDDKIVHFMNNELIYSDFFKNDYSGELINIFINFKLSNNLMEHLFEEYEQKQNILNKNN